MTASEGSIVGLESLRRVEDELRYAAGCAPATLGGNCRSPLRPASSAETELERPM